MGTDNGDIESTEHFGRIERSLGRIEGKLQGMADTCATRKAECGRIHQQLFDLSRQQAEGAQGELLAERRLLTQGAVWAAKHLLIPILALVAGALGIKGLQELEGGSKAAPPTHQATSATPATK